MLRWPKTGSMDDFMQQQFCFIFQNELLLLIKANEHYRLPITPELDHLKPFFLRQLDLSGWVNKSCYCADISSDTPLPADCYLIPLRKTFELLAPDWHQIIVKAFSILNWDRNHQFCGRCGHHTSHPTVTIFERVCDQCGLLLYPRISPSVIVCIKKNDHLLMARSPHFTKGLFGLIAGFVEVGESIEEAIHREVQEEVSIAINNLQYFGSQPWPFPDSLMIGFTADYAAGDIKIDHREIEEAGWFHYAHLPTGPSSNISIARKLIQHFVNEQELLHGSHHGTLR